MTIRFLRLWLILLWVSVPEALADSWSFKSSEQEFKFSQGFRVVAATDARKSTQLPEFHVKIYEGKHLLAHFPGMNFEHLVASPDEKLFVGLSNDGIPGTAAVIFTRDGRLRFLAVHGLAEFDYCEKSITLVRRWYDGENPNVRFDGPKETGGITVRDCKGQQIPLLEVASRAYNRAFENGRAQERRAPSQRERYVPLTDDTRLWQDTGNSEV
jgi:hypothetical protein